MMWRLLTLAAGAAAMSTDLWLEKRVSDAELERRLLAVSDPQSPTYGQYYTRDEIADLVGHSPEEVAAMSAWLEVEGLPHTVSATRDRIEVHSERFLRIEDLPASFKGVGRVVRRLPAPPSSAPFRKTPSSPNAGGISSVQVRKAYGVPETELGSGVTQLVWGPGTYGVLKSDVEEYWSVYGVKDASPDRIIFEGYAQGQRGGDNFGEASLDADIISGMAPGAKMIVSNTNDSHAPEEGPGFGAAQASFLNDLLSKSEGVSVVSLSLGSLTYTSCDLLCKGASKVDKSIDYEACLDHIQNKERQVCMFANDFVIAQANVEFMKLGLAGITVVAAAGDGGMHYSFVPFDESVLGRALNKVACGGSFPTFPASSPYVTSVGGTSWGREGKGAADPVYWPGGGAGVSWEFPMPAYQADSVKGYYAKYAASAGFPAQSGYNASNRAYPDVSALADSNAFCHNGICGGAGGTSAAAPTFGGFVSVLNAARAKAGKAHVGFLNPALYAAAAAHAEDMFEDVTEGSTKCNCVSCDTCDNGFMATPGFDLATGWGSPKWAGFVAHL